MSNSVNIDWRELWDRQSRLHTLFAAIRLTLILIVALNLLLRPGITIIAQTAALRSAIQSQPRPKDEPIPSLQNTGEITGRVVSDEGQPIENATVRIITVPGSGRSHLNDMDTLTNEEGRFRASDLAPGDYYVWAYAPGYVSEVALAFERDASVGPRYRPGDKVTITMKKGGVITGRVTNANNEPVVGTLVIATQTRNVTGRAIRNDGGPEVHTDDRGVYRIYGLLPGSYLIRVNGCRDHSKCAPAYWSDVPVYYPSAKREGAAEITVHLGEEVSGIDIRYRSELGRIISGKLTIDAKPKAVFDSTSVILTHLTTGALVGSTFGIGEGRTEKFSFEGVPDGEYKISAHGSLTHVGQSEGISSLPRRITVNGADVTDVDLKMIPLGSLAGHIVLVTAEQTSPKVACQAECRLLVEEVDLSFYYERDDRTSDDVSDAEDAHEISSNGKGEFELHYSETGRYRVMAQLPCEHWYVRAITLPEPAPPKRLLDVARNGVKLKASERAKGLTITLAEGAASVRGRIAAAEGVKLPARLRVHAIPIERECADDVLRYAETVAKSEGQFTLTNLAPGKYWLLARMIPNDEVDETTTHPAAWDNNERAKLRREAEAAKVEIELQPCQRVSDFKLQYRALATNK